MMFLAIGTSLQKSPICFRSRFVRFRFRQSLFTGFREDLCKVVTLKNFDQITSLVIRSDPPNAAFLKSAVEVMRPERETPFAAADEIGAVKGDAKIVKRFVPTCLRNRFDGCGRAVMPED